MSSFTDPIPTDGRLLRTVRRAAEHAAHARLIVRISRDASTPLERHITARFEFPDPVNLRGIPATGRGVGGTIRGTQPETATINRAT